MKIYVASSWRNKMMQQSVVFTLRAAGHEVYDFINPPDDSAFSWRQADPNWHQGERFGTNRQGNAEQFRNALLSRPAQRGYQSDKAALDAADVCVLVNPCGRSAHLEAGYAAGAGKPSLVLLNDGDEPELMYLLFGIENVCVSQDEVLKRLEEIEGHDDSGDGDGSRRRGSEPVLLRPLDAFERTAAAFVGVVALFLALACILPEWKSWLEAGGASVAIAAARIATNAARLGETEPAR